MAQAACCWARRPRTSLSRHSVFSAKVKRGVCRAPTSSLFSEVPGAPRAAGPRGEKGRLAPGAPLEGSVGESPHGALWQPGLQLGPREAETVPASQLCVFHMTLVGI